jgi:hypothetical protein
MVGVVPVAQGHAAFSLWGIMVQTWIRGKKMLVEFQLKKNHLPWLPDLHTQQIARVGIMVMALGVQSMGAVSQSMGHCGADCIRVKNC